MVTKVHVININGRYEQVRVNYTFYNLNSSFYINSDA